MRDGTGNVRAGSRGDMRTEKRLNGEIKEAEMAGGNQNSNSFSIFSSFSLSTFLRSAKTIARSTRFPVTGKQQSAAVVRKLSRANVTSVRAKRQLLQTLDHHAADPKAGQDVDGRSSERRQGDLPPGPLVQLRGPCRPPRHRSRPGIGST
jgi:hypothetical protein